MRTNSTIQNKSESSIEIIREANNTNDENTPEYCHDSFSQVVSQCSDILVPAQEEIEDDSLNNTVPQYTSTPMRNPVQEDTSHPVFTTGSELESLGYSELDNSVPRFHGSTSGTDNVFEKKGLKVIYTNIDTFLNKREEFTNLVEQKKPDVICMVEILPKSSTYSFNQSEYSIHGYCCYFPDNMKRGVVIYVNIALISSSYHLATNSYEECVFVSVNLKNQNKLLICCVYRSPNSGAENNNKLIELFNKLGNKKLTHLLIVGDFNCKEIDWELKTAKTGPDSIQAQLVQTIYTQGWFQHVNFHTRFRGSNLPSLIDLVITNEIDMIENLLIENPIGKSDHGVLIFDYLCYGQEVPLIVKPNYYKGDYNTMRYYLMNNNVWSDGEDDLGSKWANFKKTLSEITDMFIPKSISSTKNHKPWINKTAIQAVKMKHRAWNKYNKLRSTENWDMYCKARNYATFQVKTAKNDYERNIARQIKHNPKCFWKMVRDKTKVKQGIQSLMTKDGDTVQDDRSKAELLNSFFVSVFTEEDKCDIPSMQDKPFQKPLETLK